MCSAQLSSCDFQDHLQLFIDEADPRELKALRCDAHLTVDAKKLWLLLIFIRACKA